MKKIRKLLETGDHENILLAIAIIQARYKNPDKVWNKLMNNYDSNGFWVTMFRNSYKTIRYSGIYYALSPYTKVYYTLDLWTGLKYGIKSAYK